VRLLGDQQPVLADHVVGTRAVGDDAPVQDVDHRAAAAAEPHPGGPALAGCGHRVVLPHPALLLAVEHRDLAAQRDLPGAALGLAGAGLGRPDHHVD